MALTREQRTTNSAEVNTGRYTQGGLVDRYNNRLGWWERTPLPRQSDDIRFIVTGKYVARPDLIAFDVYQQVSLMWLVLQYNNIVDVNEELISGASLVLPSPRRVAVTILNNPTGGNFIDQ